MKKTTIFRPVVFSRHPTHNVLRKSLPLLPFRSIVRLGSITEVSAAMKAKDKNIIECNSVAGIKRTSNKFNMKCAFIQTGVKTPNWYVINLDVREDFLDNVTGIIAHTNNAKIGNDTLSVRHTSYGDIKYPLIAKTDNHSRGRGMVKIETPKELKKFVDGLSASDRRRYSFEEYVNYAREYRIHATRHGGIFYICRKLRRKEEEDRWYFNSKNSIFKKSFINGEWLEDKFLCFKTLEEHIMAALNQLDMDIAGFDVRINNDTREFSLIEANSACSFGEFTAEQYTKMIPEILKHKFEKTKK